MIPVVLAVTVFGVSYGVLSSGAGLPAWQTALMSATVFGGSSQFAAVSILSSGGSAWSAVSAGAFLNARYLATGAAAARVLPGGRWRRFVLAQLVVDESYALAVRAGSVERPDRRTMLRVGASLWCGWVAGTIVGGLLGPVAGEPEVLGLDAAFPSLFVALLWPLLDRWAAVRSALVGLAAAALLLGVTGSPGLALAGAAVAGLLAAGR